MNARSPMRRQSGFTLAELAIAVTIFALLLGGMFVSLSTQLDLRAISETQKSLDLVREALTGFTIAQGRLPCPASATSNVANSATGNGVEALTGSDCTATDGYVPAVTLSLAPTDAQGFLVDSWGTRIRYAVTTDTRFTTTTTANQIKQVGLSVLAPNLVVCSTGTGITATTCSGTSTTLTSSAVAVIYSLGRNVRTTGGTGTDEAPNNVDANRTFVYHERTDSAAANGEFDDLVTWLSPNILYNRLIAAGAI